MFDLKGEIVDPSVTPIKAGDKFTLATSMYVRSNEPPNPSTGQLPPVSGVGSASFFIEALGAQRPHQFEDTTQYWMQVRLLPRLLVQFSDKVKPDDTASGKESRIRLWASSEGYDTPDVKWIPATIHINEVRYFFRRDQPAAEALARRLTEMLKRAGSQNAITTKPMMDTADEQRGAEGTLELWLDEEVARKVLKSLK